MSKALKLEYAIAFLLGVCVFIALGFAINGVPIVSLMDQSGNRAKFTSLGSQIDISASDNALLNGYRFGSAYYSPDVDIASPLIFALVTPENVEPVVVISIASSTGFTYEHIENPTSFVAGSALNRNNRKRSSTNVCSCSVYVNSTFEGGYILSTNFSGLSSGDNKPSGTIVTDPVILKPGSTNILRIIPLVDNAQIGAVLRWYALK